MRIRKAILTGGGRATRLYPITTTLNKHLIPLANKPMIFHAIEKAVEAGVEEIFINLNPGDTVLPKYIGDGGHWGIKIKFFEQTGGPQGIAHVVKCAHNFIGDDPFLFYLSDNITLGNLNELFDEFDREHYDCMLAFAKVPDPQRFGVPIFNEQNILIDIVEKPLNPPNNFAQTGIYLYGPKVFFDAFNKIVKSARGEYEISSINSHLLKNNFKVGHREITGWWKDTGHVDDLLIANRLLLEKLPAEKFKIEGTVADGARINSPVAVGVGTILRKNVIINGPVIIGANCDLADCVIEPYTTIGAGCTIKQARIGNSIIFNNSQIDCDVKIENSLIGERVKIIKKTSDFKSRLIVGDQSVIEI